MKIRISETISDVSILLQTFPKQYFLIQIMLFSNNAMFPTLFPSLNPKISAFMDTMGRILLCWISRFSFSASNHNILSTKWRNKSACSTKANSISLEINPIPPFASPPIQIILYSIPSPYNHNLPFALSTPLICFEIFQNKDNYNAHIFSQIGSYFQEYSISFNLANRKNSQENFWKISLSMPLVTVE